MGRRASAPGAAATAAHHTSEKPVVAVEHHNADGDGNESEDYSDDETVETEEEEESEDEDEEDEEEAEAEENVLVLDGIILSIFQSRLARKIQTAGRRWSPALECGCLLLIFLLSFCVRLFSVIRFESVIHEFDPYFNYRATKYLVDEGLYEFSNWFDYESWYPLGRAVGQTLFPGLMCTAAALHWLAHACCFPLHIRDICVFLAPFFSGLTALATYAVVKAALKTSSRATACAAAARDTPAAAVGEELLTAEAAAAAAEGLGKRREKETADDQEEEETADEKEKETADEEEKEPVDDEEEGTSDEEEKGTVDEKEKETVDEEGKGIVDEKEKGTVDEKEKGIVDKEEKKEREFLSLAEAGSDVRRQRGFLVQKKKKKTAAAVQTRVGEGGKRKLEAVAAAEIEGGEGGTAAAAATDARESGVELLHQKRIALSRGGEYAWSASGDTGATEGASAAAAAGLFAALFIGISPSYLSRSVAGSYDNEGVAIFALVNGFACWMHAIHSSSMLSALGAAVAAVYMVTAWGGYVFLINAIAVYIAALAVLSRLQATHCVSYNIFYIIVMSLSLNIPFVGHAAISSSEHMAAHAAAAVVNARLAALTAQAALPHKSLKALRRLLLLLALAASAALFVWLTVTGRTAWSSRSLTLLDPAYAAKHLPIIASISEHQPTTWSTYIFDLHACGILAPFGILLCCHPLTDGSLFLLLFGLLAAYFSGIMVRLMLVLSPAAAALSGVGASALVLTLMSFIRLPTARRKFRYLRFSALGKRVTECTRGSPLFALGMLVVFSALIVIYISHCTWVASFVYSQPSIVLSGKMRDGSRLLQDDFREAYYWLRQNTHPRARVMSWWDYGYQATAMANRTVLADNNTWNNRHIATIALAFASDEQRAAAIMQELDVDYVFVVFGGVSRHQSDDLNKFLWMVRIASGVYPTVQQSDYLSRRGLYTVGPDAPPAFTNSLMYKLSYYGLNGLTNGYDFLRNVEIGQKEITLEHFEEAYTTENWLVRIYKVKKPANRPTTRQRRITMV